MTRADVPEPPGGLLSASPGNPQPAWVVRIVRYRWLGFGLVALFLIAAFNGHWRVGRDSAAFRGIARNLVRSHQYVFRPRTDSPRAARRVEKQEIVYPGMPLILAAVQRVFGEGDLAPQIVMVLFALATLGLVYGLMHWALGAWPAAAVTILLGLSRLFLVHANELLSDLPFLFGLTLALLGFEMLRRARGGRRWAAAAIVSACGLMFAASMRPTFWILAAAWVFTCIVGLIRPENTPEGRRRSPYALGLGLLIALALLAVALDPRTRGMQLLKGGYEGKVYTQLRDLRRLIADARLMKTLNEHIPTAVFAFGVKDSSPILAKIIMAAYALMVIGAAVALVRLRLLWGVLVAGTVVSLALLGDNPRYYLMVLPLLLAGWCLFCAPVARWFGPQRPVPVVGKLNVWHKLFGWVPRHRVLPTLAMTWGLGLILLPNILRDFDLIREQRGFDQRLHHLGFLACYEEGKLAEVVRVGEVIRRSAPPGVRILGPEPTILTYVSDRQVYDLDRVTGRWGRGWRQGLAAMRLDTAVFPSGKAAELYGGRDPIVCALFDRHVLVPTQEWGRTRGGSTFGPYALRALAGEHVRGSRMTHVRGRRIRHAATTRSQ